jgi:predicted phosphodiesterase
MKLLASGDMHLDGSKTPICRTDNYYQAQVTALEYVNHLTEKYNAKRIDAGDIVDRAVGQSVSEAIATIDLIRKNIDGLIAIAGNHCLKNKSLDYLDESIISVPIKYGNIIHVWKEPYLIPDSNVMVHGFNWGEEISHISEEERSDGNVHIGLYHGFVDERENTLIGGLVAEDIVHEFYKDYSFIITADHHKPFTYSYEGCTLINTGSLMRRTAIQIDFKPRVWLIDTETKEFEPLYLPIEDGVISDKHLVIEKEREERIDSFVLTMDEEYELTDSFEKNVEAYIAENKYNKEEDLMINPNMEKFINKALEGNIE